MKKFFRSVYLFFKGIGYARAASMHARMGDHKKAVEIMKEYEKCKWITGYLWPMMIGIG